MENQPIADEAKYKQAKEQVKELKDFYSHLFSYVGVNLTLLIIDLISGPGLWFYWVSVFWGIGLLWHILSTFIFKRAIGKDWEEKKINEIINKKTS
ncbi:MAG: putative membrane protein [uncultured bacterium]|nr:MAG: putative membrane protein [uncultured bacterium]